MNSLAKALIIIGLVFLFIGILLLLFGHLFSWFGRLPGDIRIEKENFSFYAPITSMILISIVFSLVVNLIIKLFK